MHIYSVPLSDVAAAAARKEAQLVDLEVSALLSGVLHDHFSRKDPDLTQDLTSPLASLDGDFSIERAFPKYPARSVELTQAFIDEALKFPGVSIHKQKRSLIFNPRFVFVDYPISTRGDEPGLVVSFYGAREHFDDPRGVLKAGRKSYSRMRILSDDDLADSFRFLRQAYALRTNRRA